ncbi:heme NO-binding domain-containing protein [Antarctobacter sp.]|uniref:heme NO-binding domain-containing protein n=1 Tax=Antarctobacter sp. TaxID=1872577 RepID=UPI003A9019E1
MKGVVFTEFLEMTERAIGEDAVDDLLDQLALESGGAYTSVGHYPCAELMRIVGAVSDLTGVPRDDLHRKLGGWMHGRFVQQYPRFFRDKTTALDMLVAIETEVHAEVRKLYPDAELPRFDTVWTGADSLRMTYRSDRPLVAFCHGLVEACIDHFGGRANVVVDRVSAREAVFDVRLER